MNIMGAIIDFATGKAIFAKLHPDRMVQLEASHSGHWLLDLSEDFYHNEVSTKGSGTLQRLAKTTATEQAE